MRRRGLTVLFLAVIAAAVFATWTIAYRMGESDGRNKVAAARTAFQSRAGGNPQSGAASGAPGGTGGRGAGGSAAGGGTPGAANGASGRGAAGSAASGGAARPATTASSLIGHATKIDGPTVSMQQTDNSIVTVTTNSQTAIQKLVVGALADLKAGDVITVDGTKTGDAAYSAKTITRLGQGGGTGGAPNAVSLGVPGPAVAGQIKSMDNGTITVQGFDGATVTVASSPATVVKTQQPGTLSDIKTGDLLVVQGEKTGDTGFLARSITNQGSGQ
jgi:regulator of RNase E activity RraA